MVKIFKIIKTEWEKLPQFERWLTRDADPTKGEGYCKICRVHLRAHKTDLGKHATSETHTAIANSLYRKSQPKIAVVKTSESKAKREADNKLSVFIANHSSIRCIDYLGELLAKIRKGSWLEEYRTNC